MIERAARPVDAAGLGALRVFVGLIIFAATVRTALLGRIRSIYTEPNFHFTHIGFEWVRPLPEPWMQLLFAALAIAALAMAVGFYARYSAAATFLLFTWIELSEKAAFLNHYYLLSLLCLLLVALPGDRALCVWPRRPGIQRVPIGAYWMIRFQLSVVYLFAGIAKLNSDWLVRAEPLRTWLSAHAEMPVIGGLLQTSAAGFALSYGGLVFDLSIWVFLLLPKTRRAAWALVVVFHVSVGLLFPIGVFPVAMIAATTIFFAPDWCRWRHPVESEVDQAPRPSLRPLHGALAALWIIVQLAMPMRCLLYPGPVNWTEEGFRYAWRVMLIEKTGTLEYRVLSDGQESRVFPSRELCGLQYRMLVTQPDMILEYAHHIRDRVGGADTAVYADAWVSMNGRPAARIVNPAVDLAREPRSLLPAHWILRAPPAP